MLVARYFFWVGSALVAMLLLANWYGPVVPSTPAQQASDETPVEQTIRIRSAQKLPDKVVFDTSLPTIVPPSPPAPLVTAASPPPAAAAPAPLEARAELKKAAPPPPKRVARAVRHHNNRRDYPRPDYYPMPQPSTFAFANPMTPSWSFSWR